jgi:hypothetical protein
MLLLFTIPLLKSDLDWKEVALLSVLSLLVAWSHELAAVSLFGIVLGLLIINLFKKEAISFRPLVAVIPALIVFSISVFRVFPASINSETNVMMIGDSFRAHPAGISFLTNYLNVFTPVEHYASYLELFSHVLSMFVLLYVALLPLVAVGHFKDRVLSSWALILLLGSFSCLIVPFSALLFWNRWILMLVFPFTFFAVEGLWKIKNCGKASFPSKFFGWLTVPKKVAIGLSLLSVVVGCLFMTWPLIDGKYGIIGVEGTFRYIPSTMQSSSVPLQDTEGTIEAYTWLNSHMEDTSSLLVHDVFEFWTMLYLDQCHTAILFDNDLEAASDLAVENGCQEAYFVWWNQDIGWYNLRLSNDWLSVFDSGRITVYQMV